MTSFRLIVLLALGCVVGFFILPWREEAALLTAQADNVAAQQENLVVRFEQLKVAESQTTDDPDALLERIPRQMDQERVIQNIEAITQRAGFTLTQMTFAETEDRDLKAGVLDINLIVEGNKKNIPLLLLGLEQNKRFFAVETMNTKISTADTGAKATLSLGVTTYFQR